MSMHLIDILQDSFFKILIPGIIYTIPISLISFFIGLFIAIVTALLQIADVPLAKHLCRFYIWIFRGTPLMVQLFIVFYGLPSVGILLNAIPAAILTFSLNVGAYAAETIRGAIISIPKGQMEASLSSGMTYYQAMFHIILPQSLRSSVPPLFNTFISLVKDTSLAANITVTEMFMVTQQIVARTYEPLALYILVALIYLAFSTVLTKLQSYIERKIQFN